MIHMYITKIQLIRIGKKHKFDQYITPKKQI